MTEKPKLTEIRERLAKATPWPWVQSEKSDGIFGCPWNKEFREAHPNLDPITPVGCVYDNPDSGLDPIDDEESDWNLRLILNAPSDISFLIDENAELKAALELGQINCDAVYDDLRDELKSTNKTLVLIVEERDALLEANRALQLERDMALLTAEKQSRALIEYAPTILRAEAAHGSEAHD